MRRLCVIAAGMAALGAAPDDWRPLDLENTLVVETTKGRIVVELRPEFAPLAVARVKQLAREGVYDGLQFHRVIDGFVDQTGNPDNRDGGTSSHPDLPPEFQFRLPNQAGALIADRSDGQERLLGATPFATVSRAEQARDAEGRLRGWGAYCAGVVGMGRQADPGTANSEIFFMRAPARRLDHEYAVVGRAVVGLDVIRAVAVGEPPPEPDRMLRVRVAADLPAAARPDFAVQNTEGRRYAQYARAIRRKMGATFSICDLDIAISKD